MASLERAREAKDALKRALAGRDGVTGIGLTRGPADGGGAGAEGLAAQAESAAPSRAEPQADDTWCLQVNVVDVSVRSQVPQEIDGVAVLVRVTGHVGAG